MKLITIVLLLSSTHGFAQDELRGLRTGASIQIEAENTSCGPDHFAKLSYEVSGGDWNDKTKSYARPGGVPLNPSDYNPKRLVIHSSCRPIRCYAEFISGLSHNYAVKIEQQDNQGEIIKTTYRDELTKDEAKNEAARLVRQGVCAEYRVIGFFDKVQL